MDYGDRTPMWQDSLLDTCGGLTGIIISNWFWNRKGANLVRLAPFVYTPSNSFSSSVDSSVIQLSLVMTALFNDCFLSNISSIFSSSVPVVISL